MRQPAGLRHKVYGTIQNKQKGLITQWLSLPQKTAAEKCFLLSLFRPMEPVTVPLTG